MAGWVAAAVVGSALIGSYASNKAANTQADAQKQAAATQQGMFNTINQQEQPFIQAGYGATDTLSQLLGLTGTAGSPVGSTGLKNGYFNSQFDPSTFLNSPQYQFQQQQGMQAIRNQDGVTGSVLSGSTLKDLMSFNQGLASSYYGNYFNMDQTQKNSIYGRLSGIAGMGQNAATQVGTAGTSLGTGIAQAQAAAGASQAAGIVGAANSIGGSSIPLSYLMANQGGSVGGGQGAPAAGDVWANWVAAQPGGQGTGGAPLFGGN